MRLGQNQSARPHQSTGASPEMGATPVAIVGIGESRVGRLRGMSGLRLTLEAASAALHDAGIGAKAVDGVLTRNLDMDVMYMHSQLIARHLGMAPRFTTDINLGGATAVAMLEQAGLLIRGGVCQVVLCVYGENRRTSWAVPRGGWLRIDRRAVAGGSARFGGVDCDGAGCDGAGCDGTSARGTTRPPTAA